MGYFLFTVRLPKQSEDQTEDGFNFPVLIGASCICLLLYTLMYKWILLSATLIIWGLYISNYVIYVAVNYLLIKYLKFLKY